MVASTRTTCVTSKVIPARTSFLKEGAWKVTSYGPTIRFETVYTPELDVAVARTRFVAVFRTSTLTAGTSAPLGSVTVPVMVPVFNCANAAPAHKNIHTERNDRDNIDLTLSAKFSDAHGEENAAGIIQVC